ncbi:hypothetical protein TWF173_004582 [Orbilia oligospora]|nr:hypothetical protein TWF173_004582 [Orbilia oligospora]
MSSNTAPIRLGQMSWSRVNTLDIFAARSPGFIELAFNVSNVSGGVLAKGTLKATPTEFRVLGRPDNVDFVVTWEKHPNIKAQTSIDPNIGVDPPPIHLSFIPGTAKNALGAMVTVADPTTLNFIASWMIRGILYGNKKLIEFAVPGGSVIVKIVELAETIDTVADVGLAMNDLRAALLERNVKAAVRALLKVVKGLRELAKTMLDGAGSLVNIEKQLDLLFRGALQTNLGEAAESFTEDIAEKIISDFFAGLDGELTRRKLARTKHLRYQ